MVLYEETQQSVKGMNLENIKNFFLKLTNGDLSKIKKFLLQLV